MPRILVCDDEKNMRNLLVDVLTDEGWAVDAVESGEQALAYLSDKSRTYPVLILDLSMPGMDGFEVMERLQHLGREINTIVLTAFGTIEAAVKAMRQGACDFIVKPFDNVRLRGAVHRAMESQDLVVQAGLSGPRLIGEDRAPLNIIGEDERLHGVFSVVRRVANLRTSVLIQGESGTGKELVAQAIHFNGNRRDKPFVAVNCGALPEALLESEFFGHERGAFTGAHAMQRGKFEIADGGTLFLDEVGEMPLGLQVKFLRVLQEQKFARVGGEKEITTDVRIIAATNRDLKEAIVAKTFREDLFYRLNVIPIHLPPLRERADDIPQLLTFFVQRFCQRHHLPVLDVPDDVLEQVKAREWPGNIRQLQNAVEKAVILQDPHVLIEPEVVFGSPRTASATTPAPTSATPRPTSRQQASEDEMMLDLGNNGTIRVLSEVAADAQRGAVIRALRLCNGNKAVAAKKLGVSYKTLFNKIHELGISISTNVE